MHRRNAEAGRAEDVSVSRLRAVVRRVGIRDRRHCAITAAHAACRRACASSARRRCPRCSSSRPTWRRCRCRANTLNDQVLVRYYDREWKDIAIERHAPPVRRRRLRGAGRHDRQRRPPHRRIVRQRCVRSSATGSATARRMSAAPRNGAHSDRDRRRRHRRTERRLALGQARLPRFRAARNERRRPAAIRAGARTRSAPIPGPRTTFRCPGPKAVLSASCSKSWACCATASGTSAICASPRRSACFFYGHWQEGIEPAIGLTPPDREQFAASEDLIAAYRAQPANSPFPWNGPRPRARANSTACRSPTGCASTASTRR